MWVTAETCLLNSAKIAGYVGLPVLWFPLPHTEFLVVDGHKGPTFPPPQSP